MNPIGLSFFFENSQSIYYLTTDLNGNYTYANNCFLKRFDLSLESLFGRPFSENIYEDDIQVCKAAVTACLQQPGNTECCDIRKTGKGGKFFWTRWEFCALVNEEKLAIGVQCVGYDITQRKRFETEIKKAQEDLQLLLNNTDESFMLINKKLEIVDFNQSANNRALEFLGIGLQKGSSILKFASPDRHQLLKKMHKEVFAGKDHETETRFDLDNSRYRIYSNHFKPVYNDKNEIQAVMVSSRDITEKKLAEERIIKNENHFRALIENSTDGIIVISPYGNVIDMSPSAKKILGYDVDSMISNIGLDLVHPEDREFMSETFFEVLDHPDAIRSIEYRIWASEDGYKWLSGTYQNLVKEPSIGGIVLNFRDITERKKTERALKQSEEKYRLLFYSNPQPMWIYNVDTLKFLEVNEAAIRHYGYSAAEFGKIAITDIRPETEVGRLMQALETIKKDHQQFFKGIWQHRKKNGEIIYVEVMAHDLEYMGAQARLVLAHDVTEKVKAEEKLIESNNRFIYAAKATSDIIWELDIRSDTIYFADSYKAIMGWDVGGVRKVNDWKKYIHPYDKKETVRSFEDALKDPSNELWQKEYRYLKGNGEYAYVADRGWILRDAAGKANKVVGALQDITERKTAVEELLKSNERFKIAGKATADAIWDWNLITDELFWGEGFKTLFGYDPAKQKVNISSWYDHIHMDDKERVVKGIYDLINSKEDIWTDEYRYNKSDGSFAYVIDRGVVIRDENGKPYRMIGAMQDITNRKAIENKLQRERHLLRTLIDHLPDYIYVKDVHFRHVINNVANVELIGAGSEEETIGKTVFDYFEPNTARKYIENDRKVLESGKAINNFEESIITRKGEKRWLLTTKVPLKDENNQIIGVVGISRDITERKVIEESLRISNERYDMVSKATNDAIWDWDITRNEVLWNKGVEYLFGFSQKAVEKDPEWWNKNIHPEEQERVLAKMNYHIKNSITNWNDEYRFRCADNSYKYVFDRGFILLDEFMQPYRMIGAMADISELKKLEGELAEQEVARQRQITEATIQAQENERSAIGRELHDNINQLLITSKLYIDMAINEKDLREELLRKSYAYTSKAIDEIRLLSKSLVPPSLGDIGLKEAVAEMIDSVNISQKINIKLKTSGMVKVKVPDNIKLMVFRIIQEQINNIIKHSNATEAEIGMVASKNLLNIKIADNGGGFDPKKKTKGIGLSNITTRAEMYNGHVDVISAPGQGCILKVLIPI